MDSSATAFSNDGVEVISRQIEATSFLTDMRRSKNELRRYYELDKCVSFINTNGFGRVALQFPDSLLCDSARVVAIVKQETAPEKQFFILGDTSYGSCCVDEIAAEHIQADSIIHFGPSCLTQTKRLPVLYVFGVEDIDVENCVSAFRELFPARDSRVLVLYDTPYTHYVDEFQEEVGSDYPNCVISTLSLPNVVSPHPTPISQHSESQAFCCSSCKGKGGSDDKGSCNRSLLGTGIHSSVNELQDGSEIPSSTPRWKIVTSDIMNADAPDTVQKLTAVEELEDIHTSTGSGSEPGSEVHVQEHAFKRFGRCFRLASPIDEYTVFYIGVEGPTLTNLILNYSKCQFYTYNPVQKASRRETLNVNKALGRRYFLVQKAKEARTVGILVGTLGAADYLDIIKRLRMILKKAGKKYYTIAVGKLNVAKMANFMEVDVFVLVACPENSIVDSQELYKPVVTPFEMEIACIRSREWSGEVSTNYQELLPGAAFYVPMDKDDDEAEEKEPEYSLITGGFVPTKEHSQYEEGMKSSALVTRSKMELAIQNSAAAAFLHTRSWQGLEQKLGESEVSKAVEGRTGIAASYTHEPGFQDSALLPERTSSDS